MAVEPEDVSTRVDFERGEAVRHLGGPLVIFGTAGSGKTRLIEERFAWLVGHGIAPERIAVGAPSRGRADALRERIESALERGYEQLCIGSPVELAMLVLGRESDSSLLAAGDRLTMLLERIDALSLQHHDFGGSAVGLLGRFVRRIDALKAELIDASDFAAWAAQLDGSDAAAEREFAAAYDTHERMLSEAGARDEGDLLRDRSSSPAPSRNGSSTSFATTRRSFR